MVEQRGPSAARAPHRCGRACGGRAPRAWEPRRSLRAQPGRRLARPATARLDRNLVARSEDLNEVPVRIGEGLVEGARERFPEARLVTEAIDEMPAKVHPYHALVRFVYRTRAEMAAPKSGGVVPRGHARGSGWMECPV